MGLNTKDSGTLSQIKETGQALKFGLTAVGMKGTGKRTRLTEKEGSFMLMVMCTKGIG